MTRFTIRCTGMICLTLVGVFIFLAIKDNGNVNSIISWLGFGFTISGTITGVAAVLMSHEASIKSIEASDRNAKMEMSYKLLNIKLSIANRIRKVSVELGNNISNLDKEIEEGSIAGYINSIRCELNNLEQLIKTFLSKNALEVFQKAREAALRSYKEKAENKFVESTKSSNEMDEIFKHLLNNIMPEELAVK